MIDCLSHLSFLNKEQAKKYIEAVPYKKWLVPSLDSNSFTKQQDLKKNYPDSILTSFGVHPWDVLSENFDYKQKMDQVLENQTKCDFIGEIGLDFFIDLSNEQKNLQKKVFTEQLKKTQKPLILHVVQAHGEVLKSLKDFNKKGYVHSFSGSPEIAQEYRKLGFLISFGPNILNENFKKARLALKSLQLESLLIESDTPENREDLKDPNAVFLQVAEEVAKIKKTTINSLLQITHENFQRLLL